MHACACAYMCNSVATGQQEASNARRRLKRSCTTHACAWMHSTRAYHDSEAASASTTQATGTTSVWQLPQLDDHNYLIRGVLQARLAKAINQELLQGIGNHKTTSLMLDLPSVRLWSELVFAFSKIWIKMCSLIFVVYFSTLARRRYFSHAERIMFIFLSKQITWTSLFWWIIHWHV
jgi:hypothetical protein